MPNPLHRGDERGPRSERSARWIKAYGNALEVELLARAESAEKQRDEAEAEAARLDETCKAFDWKLRETVAARDEALARVEGQEKIIRDLDALVSRFCMAVGEPVPVDAIARISAATQAEAALEERTRALRAIVTALEVNQTVPTAVYNAARAALQSEKERTDR